MCSIPIVLTCFCLGWVEPPVDEVQGAETPGMAAAFDVVASLETVLADAIARAEPSVVAIARDKAEDNPENVTLAVRGRSRKRIVDRPNSLQLDSPSEKVSSDYGSGIVIGDRGEILTAFHVVRGASTLLVRAAGRQEFEAEVIAADPRSDLAVIVPWTRPGVPPPRLKPIAIGDALKLRKGNFLIALGNPFNAARDGQVSASWGILSNFARKIEPERTNWGAATQLLLHHYPILLQLDSKLNLGMSGGAVINMRGELVGLTTTAHSPAGFDLQAGYAIPIDRIGKRIIDLLKQGKEVEYGLLGISASDGTNKVTHVQPNSPAGDGQLQVGDDLVGVNGIPISNFDGLILAVNSFSPGDAIRLTINRDGKTLERTVTLAKYPVEGEIIATNRPSAWRGLRVDYISLNYRGADSALNGKLTRGVIVSSVEEGTPAAASGLKKGQIIVKVEDQAVDKPRQFEEAVSNKTGQVSLLTDQGPVTVQAGSKR